MKALLTLLVLLDGNQPRLQSMSQAELSSMDVCEMAGQIALAEVAKQNEAKWYTVEHSVEYRCDVIAN